MSGFIPRRKGAENGSPVDIVLPGLADVSRAVIILERGDISPSLNMT